MKKPSPIEGAPQTGRTGGHPGRQLGHHERRAEGEAHPETHQTHKVKTRLERTPCAPDMKRAEAERAAAGGEKRQEPVQPPQCCASPSLQQAGPRTAGSGGKDTPCPGSSRGVTINTGAAPQLGGGSLLTQRSAESVGSAGKVHTYLGDTVGRFQTTAIEVMSQQSESNKLLGFLVHIKLRLLSTVVY